MTGERKPTLQHRRSDKRHEMQKKKVSSKDILGLIIGRKPVFTKSQRMIADAILDEPHRFVELPIEDLAAWLDVSVPTVTRFARAVDCDGLKDLKLKIMGSVRIGAHYLEPASPPGSIAEVAERVSKRAQKTIADMHDRVDLVRVEQVIDRINACRTLYAFGSGGVSSWLISEIQNRFYRLGIRVITCCDHQMQLMLASTVDRDDAVICCSLTGSNEALEEAIAVAREYGAVTIGLTASGTPLAAAVDDLLPVDSPPDDDILSPSSMRYAYLIAIDILAYGVAIAREEPGRETLRRLKQQLATRRNRPDVQPLCD
ncbi:MurR/RpiR family transcriptional regulator [Marinivivus vitaminiproducens]|uniref:MurR/RpiR family transcriptional regulator n=1 Tax=Marinivivus vitaminiproducens TaxID=3035935 RepID=UPI0027A0BC3F|nr:MurR/RpiR family transcriptional regulator [Geminicoccaceae bacterium SCSIO 64248]